MAVDSFSTMSADEISQAVTSAAAGSSLPSAASAMGAAGLPPGTQITPEMQKAAADLMGRLSEEDKAKMQAIASTMKAPPGGGMPQITPEMAEMVRRAIGRVALG